LILLAGDGRLERPAFGSGDQNDSFTANYLLLLEARKIKEFPEIASRTSIQRRHGFGQGCQDSHSKDRGRPANQSAEGKSSKEIGVLLYISDRTVHHHRAKIMKKLNFKMTADLVKYAPTRIYFHGSQLILPPPLGHCPALEGDAQEEMPPESREEVPMLAATCRYFGFSVINPGLPMLGIRYIF